MINPIMLLSPFIPTEFRPLLSCVTPNVFRVIEWQKILSFAPTIAKQIATGQGIDTLATHLAPIVPKNILLTSDLTHFPDRTSSLRPEDGSSILSLYFSQFKSTEGVFLDLRPSNFNLSQKGQILWLPNGLWKRPEPSFQNGMVSVYKGYFLDQPELIRSGLIQVGLIRDSFSASLVSKVEQMILSNLGGETSSRKFAVSHFTKNFENLFQFLIKEKIVLSPDFFYLGIQLAGLYIHLETLGGAYNVRQAFLASNACK
jgi:hypothetical protein